MIRIRLVIRPFMVALYIATIFFGSVFWAAFFTTGTPGLSVAEVVCGVAFVGCVWGIATGRRL